MNYSSYKMNDETHPHIRGIQIFQHLNKDQNMFIHSVYSCPGHLAILLSPDSINTLILLDNVPKEMSRSSAMDTQKLYNMLLNPPEKEKEKILTPVQKPQNSQGVSMESLNSFVKYFSPFGQTVETEVKEKKEIPVQLKIISQEPILAISDVNNSFVHIWFEEGQNCNLYAFQNNGLLWRWKFGNNYTWEFVSKSSIGRLNGSTGIHSAIYINTLKILVWVEKATAMVDKILKKTGGIYFKRMDKDSNESSKICDLFEKPKIEREIGLDVLELKESKNGVYVFTSEKIFHINMTTPFSTNDFPTSLLYATNIKFASNKNAFYYCAKSIHPISKELLLLGVDGMLRIVQLGFNTSILTLKELKKLNYGLEATFTDFERLIQQEQVKFGKIDLFFVNNYLLTVSNYDICVFYEPKTLNMLSKINLSSEIQNNNINLGLTWQTFNDFKMGLYSSKSIYEFKTPTIQDILKSCGDLNKKLNKITNQECYQLAQSAQAWGLYNLNIQYLLNLLVVNKKDNTITDNQRIEIYLDICKKLENPALVWCSTQNIIEQKKLLKILEEHIEMISENNTNSKKVFEKFTPLNISIHSQLKESLNICKKQLQIIEQETSQNIIENIINLTDIEISTIKPLEDLIIPLSNYFGISKIEEEKVFCEKINPTIYSKECQHSSTKSQVSCMLFEILSQALFESKFPKSLLNLINVIEAQSKDDNIKKRYSNRSLTLLNANKITKDQNDAILTYGTLLLWIEDPISAIRFYLSKERVDQIIEIIESQKLDKNSKNELYFMLLEFSLKNPKRTEFWKYLDQLSPNPYSVFNFLQTIEKNRNVKSKDIFANDDTISIERILPFLTKFSTNN